MKKTTIIIFCILGAFTGLFFVSNRNIGKDNVSNNQSNIVIQDVSAVSSNLDEIIANVIKQQPDDEIVILDVRTDQEWETEHVSGAIKWGLAEHISKGELPNIDKNTKIFVYCRSGNRAGQAIKIMQQNGFTNMVNIRGLEDWKRVGGATE